MIKLTSCNGKHYSFILSTLSYLASYVMTTREGKKEEGRERESERETEREKERKRELGYLFCYKHGTQTYPSLFLVDVINTMTKSNRKKRVISPSTSRSSIIEVCQDMIIRQDLEAQNTEKYWLTFLTQVQLTFLCHPGPHAHGRHAHSE